MAAYPRRDTGPSSRCAPCLPTPLTLSDVRFDAWPPLRPCMLPMLRSPFNKFQPPATVRSGSPFRLPAYLQVGLCTPQAASGVLRASFHEGTMGASPGLLPLTSQLQALLLFNRYDSRLAAACTRAPPPPTAPPQELTTATTEIAPPCGGRQGWRRRRHTGRARTRGSTAAAEAAAAGQRRLRQ